MSAIDAIAIARPTKPTASSHAGRDAAFSPTSGGALPVFPTIKFVSRTAHVNRVFRPKMPRTGGVFFTRDAADHIRRRGGVREIDAARALIRATACERAHRGDHAGAERH